MAESELERCRCGLCCRSEFQSLFLMSGELLSYTSVCWGLYCRALSLQSAKVLRAEAALTGHLWGLLLLGGLWAPRGVFTIPPSRGILLTVVVQNVSLCFTFRISERRRSSNSEWSVPCLDIWQTIAVVQGEKKKNPVFGNSAPRCCCCSCSMEFAVELDSYQFHIAPAWNFIRELSFWLRSNAGQPVIFCCLALSNCLAGL